MCFLRTLPHFLITPIPLCCCGPFPSVIDLCHVSTYTLLLVVSTYLPYDNEGSGLVWFIIISLVWEAVPVCLLSVCWVDAEQWAFVVCQHVCICLVWEVLSVLRVPWWSGEFSSSSGSWHQPSHFNWKASVCPLLSLHGIPFTFR